MAEHIWIFLYRFNMYTSSFKVGWNDRTVDSRACNELTICFSSTSFCWLFASKNGNGTQYNHGIFSKGAILKTVCTSSPTWEDSR